MSTLGRRATASLAGTAGILAIGVSVVVAVSLPVRDVDFNVLNLWTLLLGAAGGALALRGRSAGWFGAAIAMMAMAALPALFGWVGWLYVPSIELLVVELARTKHT